jgi:hypothetical protein
MKATFIQLLVSRLTRHVFFGPIHLSSKRADLKVQLKMTLPVAMS